MLVFEYDDYKSYVNAWVQSHPKKGYGLFAKMAAFLETNSVIISQVFKGSRDLNLEQAAKLARFLALGTIETDHFLLLVQLARSGTSELKQIVQRQLKENLLKGQSIKNRIEHKQLTDEDKAIFYSSWHYIAIWLAAPIPELGSVSKMAKHFQLPDDIINDAIQFLLERGLLKKSGNGFDFGKNIIHVPHDSPFVAKHHSNWRIKALQSVDRKKDENLHYTAPMSLSEDIGKKIREELIQFIQKQTTKVSTSPSEKLMCLNIDWFEY